MTLRTFQAATMAEALTQVKRAFGPDAVILHTRSVQRRKWLGLGRTEVVEVTAGPNTGERRRTHRDPQRDAHRDHSREPRRHPEPRREPAAGPAVNFAANPAAAAYARNSNLASAPVAGGVAGGAAVAGGVKGLFSSPEMTQVMVKLVTEEVTGLRTELKELIGQVRRTGGATGAAVPDGLSSFHAQLLEQGVDAQLAEDVVKAVGLRVPAGYLKNAAFVREKVIDELERLVPVSGPIRGRKAKGPYVVALIGPTGVGKTTTIAKLAADLQLREGKRVGLLTLDTFRIAAVEQLRRYAEIIGSPLRVVGSAEEMASALAAMAEMDYVLVDTAGRSPTDTLKLSELRGFLDAAKPDEVHLVLSTTSDPRCLSMAVTSFCKVRADKLLLTKADEAFALGGVLNLVRKLNLPVSYLTTGQDVPDDIEVVQGRKLAGMILGSVGVEEAGGKVKTGLAVAGGVK